VPRPSKLELPFDPETMGIRIEHVMRESGFNLSGLARDSGVDKAKLSKAIRGKSVLNLPELVRVCQTTGFRAGWVISAEEPIWADSAIPIHVTV
jgi:DNA-binding phage protein